MSRSLTALRAVRAIIITLISLVTVVVTKIQADDLIVSLPASIGLSYLQKNSSKLACDSCGKCLAL